MKRGPLRFAARLGLLLVFLAVPLSAVSASPADRASDPARALLITGKAEAGGTLRGYIQIDLAPGWHTYWTDPGAAGIPPSVDFSATPGLAESDLLFPLPIRFGEGATAGIGYEERVLLPFVLRAAPGATLERIRATLFIGVCREICIPFQASLSAKAGTGTPDAIASAFEALPEGSGAAPLVTQTDDALVLRLPTGVRDAFPELPSGWVLGAPTRKGADAPLTYPLLARPRHGPQELGAIDILLSGPDPSGTLHQNVPVRTSGGETRLGEHPDPQ